jgi:hypothetical protein
MADWAVKEKSTRASTGLGGGPSSDGVPCADCVGWTGKAAAGAAVCSALGVLTALPKADDAFVDDECVRGCGVGACDEPASWAAGV